VIHFEAVVGGGQLTNRCLEQFPESERETILKALPALRDHLSLSGCALAERAEVLLPVSGAGIILRPPLINPTVVVQPEFPQRFSRPRRKAMRAKTKLKPSQDGAKSLSGRYGGQSLCVRHRYGEARGLRHKTIGLTAGTIPWSRQTAEIPIVTIVGLNISLREVELQTVVIIQADGKWSQKLQLLSEVRQGARARPHIRNRAIYAAR